MWTTKASNTSNAIKSPGITDQTSSKEATEQVNSHPTPENKMHAVEVLDFVFGRGSEKVAESQREERTGVVNPVSEN